MRDRVRDQEISVAGRGGRRRRHASGTRRRTPRLAIVVHGGTVQGVYADRRARCTIDLLDYDDLGADDDLAEHVAGNGELPQVTVEAGLARAVAEYRAVATRQARCRQVAEAGR